MNENTREKVSSDSRLMIVSGATGLIGSALCEAAAAEGWRTVVLVRRREKVSPDHIYWSPEQKEIDKEALEGADAIVHLAGEGLASGRWTAEKKERIRRSRVEGTAFLCRALAGLNRLPRKFLCASAVGYYGDCGDQQLDEASTPGEGFLSDVCQEWEAAGDVLKSAGVDVTHLRFGVVLSERGGALAKMLPIFKLGLGGRLGPGSQYMSWIHLDDCVKAILYCASNDSLTGPVNITSPDPVRNDVFADHLGAALRRPTFIATPGWALRLVLGKGLADDALLSSARVTPRKLQDAGFVFQYPQLESALRQCVSK